MCCCVVLRIQEEKAEKAEKAEKEEPWHQNDSLSQMPDFFEMIQHPKLPALGNVWMKICVQQSTSINHVSPLVRQFGCPSPRNHCRSQWRSSETRIDFLELYRRSIEKLSVQTSQEFAQNQPLSPDAHRRRFLKEEILPKLAEAVGYTGQVSSGVVRATAGR